MSIVHLSTPIPGPKSRALLAMKEEAVPDALTVHLPVAIESGSGARVTDVDGNVLIDLAGGLGCLNVGHSHPEVVRAIRWAAGRFTHTDFTVVMYESYIKLATELCRRAPGAFPKKAAFFNSGAEAVENAIKFARKYTGKRGIITFEGAFHGRTNLAMALTSKANPYKNGFGPFAPDIYRIPYPYGYRWPGHPEPHEVARQAAEALEKAFVNRVAKEDCAAVIIEPVQGEGGFIVPPREYLPMVQQICQRNGVLLIVDEIQSGYGRTGRFFASEHFGIEPDLICIGKSVAAGLPLSGVVGRAEILDSPGDSAIGGTYVGNPIACEAALAVLRVMDQEQLTERAQRLGRILTERFESLAQRCHLIGEVRGLGAMVGVEFVRDRESREPAAEELSQIIARCSQKGLIVVRAGLYKNVLRFLMPLVITDEELHEALDIIQGAVLDVAEEWRNHHIAGVR